MFKQYFSTRRKLIVWLFVLLAIRASSQVSFASVSNHLDTERDEMRRVNQAAVRVIQRFHETLDFGVTLGESTISDLVRQLGRKKVGDLLDLSPLLSRQIDEATLTHAYKAFMNFTYVRAAYNATFKLNERVDEDRAPLPPEVRSALQESRYLRVLISNNTQDAPIVATADDLKKYIADLERVGTLYKKHVPLNAFASRVYRVNIKARESAMRSTVEMQFGNEYLGIAENTRVYVVRRDLFTMYFTVEKDQPKLKGFGFDN